MNDDIPGVEVWRQTERRTNAFQRAWSKPINKLRGAEHAAVAAVILSVVFIGKRLTRVWLARVGVDAR